MAEKTLSALADAVVIANATGNPDLYRDAVAALIAGVRSEGPMAIQYNALGDPTNLPGDDPVLLYGMDGLDAEGPVLGQWDSTMQVWSDHEYGQINWHPMFFAIPPENPCKSITEPTCNNEVV